MRVFVYYTPSVVMMHGVVKLMNPKSRLALIETPNGYAVIHAVGSVALERGDSIDGPLEFRGLGILIHRPTGLVFEAFVELASPQVAF